MLDGPAPLMPLAAASSDSHVEHGWTTKLQVVSHWLDITALTRTVRGGGALDWDSPQGA